MRSGGRRGRAAGRPGDDVIDITGFQKCSLVDWDGHICAVVFTQGCNLNCWYCHNRRLIARVPQDPLIPEETVLAELERRRGFLDGVVFSGGEPTIQPDLAECVERVRALGFRVKLDTNGTHPEVLSALLSRGLLDYVAMDVKAPPSKLEFICGGIDEAAAIEASINLLLLSDVDYEFRTTVAPQLTHDDVLSIAHDLRGARRYVLQQCRVSGWPGADRIQRSAPRPHSDAWLMNAAAEVQRMIPNCKLRGLTDTTAAVALSG